ncbi:MAG TPA: Ig-like domain-containing protein, partial [Rhodothermales bacterium]
ADLDPLAFDVDVDPAGIVDVRVTGSVLTLTPRRRGTAHLTVHAQDGAGGDATMEFDATVSGNRSPSAKPETRTLKEDTPLAIAVLDNDTDADGDPLTISIHTPPRNGTAEVTGNVILYTPASEYSGSDSFVYLISDGFGGTSSAVVYLEITQTNDAPTFATPDAITAPADGAEIEFTPQTIAAGASLTITWALATDAEKEAVQYQWQASLRADFSTYLTLVNLPPTGTYSRTLAQINAMLDAAFVPATGPVTLYHRILASDGRATTATDPRSIVFVRVDETATARETEQPGRFALGQNYPNPFNPQTTIDYELDRPGPATLTLVNMLGQEVAVLADGEHVAGRHSVVLNARDLPSGVYVYRLSAAGRVAARTAVLMK